MNKKIIIRSIIIALMLALPGKIFAQISEITLKKSLNVYLDHTDQNNKEDTLKVFLENDDRKIKRNFSLNGIPIKIFDDYKEVKSGEFLSVYSQKKSQKKLEVIFVRKNLIPQTPNKGYKIISGSGFVAIFKLSGKRWKYSSHYEMR